MNTKPFDAIAKAVLYEGYMLYPYRPSSVKNRQRFNFGVLYPESYAEESGSDRCSMRTELLLEGDAQSTVEIKVRFLLLVDRSLRKLRGSALPAEETSIFEEVSVLEVDGRRFVPWQEAVERGVSMPPCNPDALCSAPQVLPFAFPASEEVEPSHNAAGGVEGMIVRKRKSVCGTVEVVSERAAGGIYKLRVLVKNQTPFEETDCQNARDSALAHSLVSAHVLLGVTNGEFVSLLEPPANLSELAASCENIGAWPVLVGAEGERNTMLASPIILYDYPQIAPESPGDLFDGTEIDEILALRILTMTDAEKSEMRSSDERSRKILERTESLPIEHLMKLHGILREVRPLKGDMP
jgi:hydrogenase maturation protease